MGYSRLLPVGRRSLVLIAAAALCAAEPAKLPWQRLLQGEDAKQATEQEKKLVHLLEAGQFDDALKVAEALAERRAKAQGVDHWQAIDARFEVEAILRVRRAVKEEQQSYIHSIGLQRQADALAAKGRYREAQPLIEQCLAIRRKLLGEEHPDTAASYNNLALNLKLQGKYKEAEAGYRKALAIRSKVLGEEHPDTAISYNNFAMNLLAQDRYREAEEGLRKALAIRRKVLGEEHPATAEGYNNVATALFHQVKYREAEEGFRKALAIYRKALGEEHPETAASYDNLANALNAQTKYKEADDLLRKALATRRKVLGEEHPDTALSYNNLAYNLHYLGKFAEEEDCLRKALAIRCKVLGEEHPLTAQSYNNIAYILSSQGKYKEAEEGYRKSLTLYRKLLGDEHSETAQVYSNVGAVLNNQGKYREAEESHRKALAIRRKVLGENNPDTAQSYSWVAANLNDQGRYGEAEAPYRKALEIYRNSLGDQHELTALGYTNLALNLNAQGKYKEAEERFAKALAMRRKVLGEEHPLTANSYNNVALSLNPQGKYQEAEQDNRKALAIYRKKRGEEHPGTATSYSNLALNLHAQGKYQEAEQNYRTALAIWSKLLGEEHPDTARGYADLAHNLRAQGKYREAESIYQHAAESFAKVRIHVASSGLNRASFTSNFSPLPALSAILARNGKPDAAWQRFEESLARGTWDDLSERLRRPSSERAKQDELSARLKRLDTIIAQAYSVKEPTPEQLDQRKTFLTQQRQTLDELAAFTRRLEDRYGPTAGKVFAREKIQASLPADAALIGWLDLPGKSQAADPNGEHWAVLLRSAGLPVWVQLPGSGDRQAWTDADSNLPTQLRVAFQSPRSLWQPLAQRLRRQRLEPLAPHLKGVRRLIVLPSTALAGVPVEVITSEYTVSYAHSGTMHAYFHQLSPSRGKGLFALADPVFETPAGADTLQPLPPSGVLLTIVQPGSNAHEAGLKVNDVLLRYGDKELSNPIDFKPQPESKDPKHRVPVVVWRDGKTLAQPLLVRAGKVGVVLAKVPAREALADKRRWDRWLASRSGDDMQWDRLPGTRYEVASLRRLFAKDEPAELLLDSEAGEAQLYERARSGVLGRYRYLHLATHGQVDDVFPLRSAVILSRDKLPDERQRQALLHSGQPIPDGRLTAEEALQQWNLDCDLVTLSACQTALGRYERGEGFVGFAQALILAGSRSVCLSLWKVNDVATALLMERFYQNLLGKREGLKTPLPKAAALVEAKQWLRQLPRAQALQHAASLSAGVERGLREKLPPLEVPSAQQPAAKTDCPYAHPYYWAAFVLIGDPE